MAGKNISELKIKLDTKTVKLNESKDVAEQDTLCYERGLELSGELPTEIKYEADVLNEVDNILENKSSAPFLKTLLITASSTPINKVIKKEIITYNEESSLNVPAYAPVKSGKAVHLQDGEENFDNTATVNEASEGNKKGGGQVIRLAVKDLSDEERKKLRAKRFNIIVPESSLNVKQIIPNQVPNVVTNSTSDSTNNPTPTFNVLKKRSERFGESVSTVMRSLDHREKLLKRKLKFLESVTNLKELELKKKRSERFRMV